jgi:hypothetical protein
MACSKLRTDPFIFFLVFHDLSLSLFLLVYTELTALHSVRELCNTISLA